MAEDLTLLSPLQAVPLSVDPLPVVIGAWGTYDWSGRPNTARPFVGAADLLAASTEPTHTAGFLWICWELCWDDNGPTGLNAYPVARGTCATLAEAMTEADAALRCRYPDVELP